MGAQQSETMGPGEAGAELGPMMVVPLPAGGSPPGVRLGEAPAPLELEHPPQLGEDTYSRRRAKKRSAPTPAIATAVPMPPPNPKSRAA